MGQGGMSFSIFVVLHASLYGEEFNVCHNQANVHIYRQHSEWPSPHYSPHHLHLSLSQKKKRLTVHLLLSLSLVLSELT